MRTEGLIDSAHHEGEGAAPSPARPVVAETIAALAVAVQFSAMAEPTPVDAELKVDAETAIECEYRGGDAPIAGILPTPGIYHYRLYLPRDYNQGTQRHYPVMFIASPSGNAAMGAMADRLKRDRWIVAMLVESRNGPDEAPTANFLAAHDDVLRRTRALPDLKAATGLSGGARASSFNAAWRPGFRAVIFQAAGFFSSLRGPKGRDIVSRYPDGLMLYALFGNADYNFAKNFESEVFRRDLPPRLVPRVEIFRGGHNWAPAGCFSNAMDMLEATVFLDPKTNPSPRACSWYFDTLAERLNITQDPMTRRETIDSALAVALTGRLQTDPAVAARITTLKETVAAIRAQPGMKREMEARKAYRKACEARTRFDDKLRGQQSYFGRQRMEPDEKKLLQDLAGALGGVAADFAGSRAAARAIGELTALRLEYKDHLPAEGAAPPGAGQGATTPK